ncbi:MAG: ATP-binding protein, partial [Chloroflexota bacterium]
KDEIEALMQDLENVGEGGATFRFVVGRYGSGKTFMLQLLRNQAMERGYIVADVDLSPERRLTGTNDAGVATYRELMHNLSSKARPDGGALSAILERWISTLQSQVITDKQLQPGDPAFNKAVEARIYDVIHDMEGMVHGFDYATVISSYWKGHVTQNDALKDAALRWLRGEFSTKTEARQALGVRVIVNDHDWYDYIKLFAQFVADIGYKGLVVLMDEAVNLYKISNTVSRHNNYEKLLTMFNDTMQGKAAHLSLVMGGTPQFLEDERRGLYSYEALYTRLSESRFADKSLRDVSGPVIRLDVLGYSEIHLLLSRILDVYISHNQHNPELSAVDLQHFMQIVVNRLGAGELLTPREVVRDFISVLNLVRQNPQTTFQAVIGSEGFQPSLPGTDPNSPEDEFAEFEL